MLNLRSLRYGTLACLLACQPGAPAASPAATPSTASVPQALPPALPSGLPPALPSGLPQPLSTNASKGSIEHWTGETGPVDLLSVRGNLFSTSCAASDCDARKEIAKGKHIDLTAEDLSKGLAPGIVACKRLAMIVRVLRSPTGDEESFCVFRDGSLVSTNALEKECVR
jgi:hypothetical protein